MRTSTKILILIWILIGLPVAYVVNFWGTDWWSPFPVPKGQDAGYYFAWFVTFTLIYLLPLFLLVRGAIFLNRRLRGLR